MTVLFLNRVTIVCLVMGVAGVEILIIGWLENVLMETFQVRWNIGHLSCNVFFSGSHTPVQLNKPYWCIDCKFRIYVERLRNGGFSESFLPFRAKPYKFYIYRHYTNIVYIHCFQLKQTTDCTGHYQGHYQLCALTYQI